MTGLANIAQEVEALGGLDYRTRRQLQRRGPVKAEGLGLGIGAILRREWQGRAVEADGFRWNDQSWPSLSAVATTITGTRWNGPRSFGLRQTSP